MAQAEDQPSGLFNGYFSGRLTPEEESNLFNAAAEDQETFNLLMEAEAVRDALSSDEQRNRLKTALQLWDDNEIREQDRKTKIESVLANARHLIEAGQFSAAEKAINDALSQYPG